MVTYVCFSRCVFYLPLPLSRPPSFPHPTFPLVVLNRRLNQHHRARGRNSASPLHGTPAQTTLLRSTSSPMSSPTGPPNTTAVTPSKMRNITGLESSPQHHRRSGRAGGWGVSPRRHCSAPSASEDRGSGGPAGAFGVSPRLEQRPNECVAGGGGGSPGGGHPRVAWGRSQHAGMASQAQVGSALSIEVDQSLAGGGEEAWGNEEGLPSNYSSAEASTPGT